MHFAVQFPAEAPPPPETLQRLLQYCSQDTCDFCCAKAGTEIVARLIASPFKSDFDIFAPIVFAGRLRPLIA